MNEQIHFHWVSDKVFGFQKQRRILFEQEVLQAFVTYLPHITESRAIGPTENYNNLCIDLTNGDI